MEKISRYVLFAAISALLYMSCKKDETRIVYEPSKGKAPQLTATESNIRLLEERQENTAIVFSWTKASVNFNASFTYTLQFDSTGRNFQNAVEKSAGTALTFSITEGDLNDLVKSLGIGPDTAGTVEVRLKAVLNDSAEALYSTSYSLVVTPFAPAITDQYIFVPGAYQGWDPPTADTLRSKALDNNYEGYVYFPEGSLEFKFTEGPSWATTTYGDAGDGTSGNIATPGNNFKVPAGGYYKLQADLVANTWSNTKTDWGVIGSATPNGWDSDQDMVYDPGSKTWSITLPLSPGEIKFRANDDWVINLGDDGVDGTLEYNGANIAVGVAGNYTITLDLHSPWHYIYTLQKN